MMPPMIGRRRGPTNSPQGNRTFAAVENIRGAAGPRPSLAPYPCACELVLKRVNRLGREIAPINVGDRAGFVVVDDQPAVLDKSSILA